MSNAKDIYMWASTLFGKKWTHCFTEVPDDPANAAAIVAQRKQLFKDVISELTDGECERLKKAMAHEKGWWDFATFYQLAKSMKAPRGAQNQNEAPHATKTDPFDDWYEQYKNGTVQLNTAEINEFLKRYYSHGCRKVVIDCLKKGYVTSCKKEIRAWLSKGSPQRQVRFTPCSANDCNRQGAMSKSTGASDEWYCREHFWTH